MRAIITYHSIDSSGSVISIDEPSFRAHVRWLASGVVRVVSLAELSAAPDDDRDTLAITFDDGASSVASVAAPLLREHGLPATVFAVSGYAGANNDWGGVPQPGIPTLDLLGWDELARLGEAGFAIGSHTATHRSLRGLPTAAMEDEVAAAAERILANTGKHPEAFAYPYGECDDRAQAVVSRYHRLACTTELRTVSIEEQPLRLPRLDTYYLRAPGRLESWGSVRLRASLRLRAGARRLRRTLSASM